MNLPVKQHIVPKTYLEQFVSCNDKLWVFQKDTKSVRQQSINKVPIIKDFYTINENKATLEPYAIENFLATELEPLYKKYVKVFNEKRVLDILEKQQFAYVIASQKMRTVGTKKKVLKEIERALLYGESGNWVDKESIKVFAQTYYDNEEEISQKDFISRTKGIMEGVSADITEDCYIQILIDKTKELGELLAVQKWSYLVAPQGRFFLTSDNPVILENEIEDRFFPIEGLIFPVTPQVLINLNLTEEKIRVAGANEVKKVNQQIINKSDRFVFSNSENLLRGNVRKLL
ncbi:DUF4238 domain-containing protein [Virgibacillus halodenitrificans]|uniref:DUF4238 domain-containing protein n=1 Tax=Virgibacillus halodenitrificans TaxID=1482 RepID=A0ABR7VVP0_VIRHA|nr:DUF4238 domain-containing protein [Virgibacillus halodenitrificans]MBD1224807.1 DUF4238 domain-containing protein [Virgibacillus halodenitrificans]